MATVSYAITTLAKVKTYAGISGTTHDALIEELIAYITDFVETYCGKRRFKETQYTNEEYDLPDGNLLFTKQFPITELTSLQYFSGTLEAPVWTSFAVGDYQLYGNEGYIKFFHDWIRAAHQIRLLRATYKAGFKIDFTDPYNTAVHTLPFDITMVATQLVAKLFKTRTASGIKSESTEGQSITYDTDSLNVGELTLEQNAVLENYKRMSYGF